jgi:hypothetical protein
MEAEREDESSLLLERPNERSPCIYLVRLVAFVLIPAAIRRKDYGRAT